MCSFLASSSVSGASTCSAWVCRGKGVTASASNLWKRGEEEDETGGTIRNGLNVRLEKWDQDDENEGERKKKGYQAKHANVCIFCTIMCGSCEGFRMKCVCRTCLRWKQPPCETPIGCMRVTEACAHIFKHPTPCKHGPHGYIVIGNIIKPSAI